MTYIVPDAGSDGEFEFAYAGGSYSVPLIRDLPLERIDAMNALRGQSSTDLSIRELTILLFGEDVGAVVVKMSPTQFSGLVEAWQAASEMSLGES